MALEPRFTEVWDMGIADLLERGVMDENLAQFAADVAAAVKTLAQAIDSLRAEIIQNGLPLSE